MPLPFGSRLFLSSLAVLANGFVWAMDPEAMQRMADCMADIDQQALAKLEADSRAFYDRIDRLCRTGQRDAAQSLAIEQSRAMARDPEMRKLQAQIKKCSQIMPGMMPPIETPSLTTLQQRHICDTQ